MNSLARTIHKILQDPTRFSQAASHIQLRPYQIPPINAITQSIRHQLGLSIVIIFSRQAGKNETQLALYTYLLTLFQRTGGNIIHVEPTYKPQLQTSMTRLEARLSTNILTRGKWQKRFGYTYQIGHARIIHLSGDSTANVVGATASLLLSVNEAQDISPQKYDKDFSPMVASTNATRVFWGTRWTSDTLLERELQSAQRAQDQDGIQRVFIADAAEVGRHVPAYATFVQNELTKHGRNHPLIKTQYFCETIEAQTGMFTPERIMLMRGTHPRQSTPTPGNTYALLIDVGGQDLTLDPSRLNNPARDSTALTIAEISPESLPTLRKPTYRILDRHSWQGLPHTTTYARICALMDTWHFQHIIIDATGIGEGLYSMLSARYGSIVTPYKFTESSKSELGYTFLSIIDTGRYKDYHPLDNTLLEQCQKCRAETRPGPAKILRWSIPDSTRSADGTPLHDDLLLSAALCAVLDHLDWAPHTHTITLPTPNLLNPIGY